MGANKALLEIGGEALIVRVARLVESVAAGATVVGRPETYQALGLRAIADDWPGCGPLGGIATSLRTSQPDWNLIVACDLPYLTLAWLEFLLQRARRSDADAIVPMNTRGAEPLCAVYHKRGAAALRRLMEQGVRKVSDGLAQLRVEAIEPAEWKGFDSEGLLFKNVNAPADYEEARAKLAGRAGK